MKHSIRVFIDKNKLITAFFVISVVVIVTYILSMDLPEWFNGAGDWFNLLFQLAVRSVYKELHADRETGC